MMAFAFLVCLVEFLFPAPVSWRLISIWSCGIWLNCSVCFRDLLIFFNQIPLQRYHGSVLVVSLVPVVREDELLQLGYRNLIVIRVGIGVLHLLLLVSHLVLSLS